MLSKIFKWIHLWKKPETKKQELPEPQNLYELYLYKTKQIFDLLMMHWYKYRRDKHTWEEFYETKFMENDSEIYCWFFTGIHPDDYWVFYNNGEENIILNFNKNFYEQSSRYNFNYIDLKMKLKLKLNNDHLEKLYYETLKKTHIIWNPNPEFSKLFSQLNEIEETRKKLLDMIKNFNS